MKTLLTVTAVLEAGAGLGLAALPSAAVAVLLGSPLDTPNALVVGRVAGVALLALGAACWLSRNAPESRAARGVVGAMVVYNLGAVIVLAAAGIWSQPVGVALWPVVVLHAAMAVWCVAAITRRLEPGHETDDRQ
jgi:Kef-type K+ transport system membrane component KefB